MRARAENQKVVLEAADSQRLDILGFHQPLPNACTVHLFVLPLRRDLESHREDRLRLSKEQALCIRLALSLHPDFRGRCSRR